MASTPHVELIEASIFGLLLPDVFPDHRFGSAYGRDEVAPGPEVLPYEVALPLTINTAKWMALLPLMYPITCETAYFGGIAIIM